MNFAHTDLGHRQRGETIEVTLRGNAANVRLLDSSNYSLYKNGKRHRMYGGLVKRSPYRVQIPQNGHWHIAIDMQGLRGRTNSTVRVLPGRLPAAQERPLKDVPSLLHDHSPDP